MLKAWMVPVVAARLYERIEGEEKMLLALVRRAIAI
jgi:hypothetical protein